MTVNKKIKKLIIDDWRNAFPQLTLYAQDKLYKRVGPLIIGLEFTKIPRMEEYRPHFVMYALFGNKSGNDLKSCLSCPILQREFYDKKGFQFNIPYEQHTSLFGKILESIRKQLPLPFDININLDELITAIDEYSKTSPLNAAPNSYLQAKLQEAKLKIILYIKEQKAQEVLIEIKKHDWDEISFSLWQVNLNKWLLDVQNTILNRKDFIKQINFNKEDRKIAQLKSSEIII